MVRNCSFLCLCLAALLAARTNATTHLRPMLGPDADEAPSGQKATIQAKTYKQGAEVGGGVQRYLQSSVVINALINTFVPGLVDQLEGQISRDLDPINVNYATTDDQGEVQLNINSTFCNATTANSVITYSMGTMTGLATMDITRLELVEGSEDIDVPFLSLFGVQRATWSGTWIVEADFKRFNAQTKATLSNTFCGFSFEEMLTGTSTLGDPTMAARIYLAGETSNIYSFNDNSQLNEGKIREMTFSYASLTPRLGQFGDLVTLDANAPLVDIGQTGLADELQALIMTNAQAGLDQQLPYKL